MTKKIAERWGEILLLLLIISGGLYVRFADLETHFTHVDDILVAVIIQGAEGREIPRTPDRLEGPEVDLVPWLDRWGLAEGYFGLRRWVHRTFPVSIATSYAPWPFLAAGALIERADPYRETLFWGRLPAAIAGLSALPLFWLAARRFLGPRAWPAAMVGVALLSFSQMHVVYAKQMGGYAFGVPAVLLLLLLFEWAGRMKRGGWAHLAVGLALGLLVGVQYQLLFLLPAFYLALFLGGEGEGPGTGRVAGATWTARTAQWFGRVGPLLGSALIVWAFIAFYYLFFLFRWSSQGTPPMYHGVDGAFVLQWDPGASWLTRLGGLIAYLARNGVVALQDTVTFVSPQMGLYALLPWIVTPLSLWGWWLLMRAGPGRKRRLGLFCLFTGAVWILLILKDVLTLSPTRHALVLLPLMALTLAVGMGDVIRRVGGRWGGIGLEVGLAGLAILLIMGARLYEFPQERERRRDPYDEQAFAALLETHRVETVIGYDCTINPLLMPSVRRHYPINYGCPQNAFFTTPLDQVRVDRLALTSHRTPLTPQGFYRLITEIDGLAGRPDWIDPHAGRYRMLARIERPSEQEIGVSRRIRNGANGLYIYILEKMGR